MKVRRVVLALVSSVYLVALGANSGSASASSNPVTAQAYAALTAGDSAKAISLYSFAIESRALEPEMLANALLNRALAYQQTNAHDKAIDDYSAALSLDAMSAELRATALYNRGLSQQKLGQRALAIEDFTSSLLLNPSFPHAFLARANSLRDSGQYLFALSDYERALKFNHPEVARVYFGEAQTYELLKRPTEMKRMLEAARAADPNYGPAQEKLSGLVDALPQPTTVAATADADPILTASISAVGGSTIVHKPDFPKGVEPPDNLVADAAAVEDVTLAQTEKPVFKKVKKLYTDRVPQSSVVANAAPVIAEKVVAVSTVPAIPAMTNNDTGQDPASDPMPVAASDAAGAPAVVPAPVHGWSVQIASAASEDGAWSTWKNMQKRFKVLGSQTPVVMKADLGTKGIFYRVRLAGFDNQSGAQSACSKLKAAGVTCFVSKAEG